jgi:hypothetical protein
MRTSPLIVPHESDDTYIVMDDFGQLGRCWHETDADSADRQTNRDLVDGHYKNPVCIVAFNTAEGLSCDVTIEMPMSYADDPLSSAICRTPPSTLSRPTGANAEPHFRWV